MVQHARTAFRDNACLNFGQRMRKSFSGLISTASHLVTKGNSESVTFMSAVWQCVADPMCRLLPLLKGMLPVPAAEL